MKPTPLFLKISGSSESSEFHLSTENAIKFQDNTFEFSSIFHDHIPADALHSLTKTSATLILFGSVSGGKNKSFGEILRYFANVDTSVQVSASEVHKSNVFTDLLDENMSSRYMSSVPFDNQLKKVALDGRVVLRMVKERPLSNRSFLLVNIYHDSKILTIVDAVNEKYASDPSAKLITNLVSRRVSSANISFIVHLHQKDNSAMIQSSLVNLASAVKTLSAQPKKSGLAIPATKLSRMPNYAKPTVSSSSPKELVRTYKVSKPSGRIPTATSKPRAVTGPINRTSASRLRTPGAVSPAKKSHELKKLQEKVTVLEEQLSNDRSQFVNVIKSFKAQLREVRSKSSVMSENLVRAHSDFDSMSQELKNQNAFSQKLDENLRQLHSDKSLVEQKLANALEIINEKEEKLIVAEQISANERLSMTDAFESEITQMREKGALLEAEIASLTSTRSDLEAKISGISSERKELSKEKDTLAGQWSQAMEEKKILEEKIQNMFASSEKFTKELQAEISEKNSQIQTLQEQLISEQSVLAEKNSLLDKEVEVNRECTKSIESLQNELVTKSQNYSRREQEDLQKMEYERAKAKADVQRLEGLVSELTANKGMVEAANKAHESEISNLKNILEEKSNQLLEARAFQEKCTQLEALIEELSETARQRDIEHEKHVIRLNEELGKAKIHESPPKKLVDIPDLDFSHGNNTFSSLDIYEDQTEYTNFFRRPALGRSPVPSPTRVLTESNVRANIEPKVFGKHDADMYQVTAHSEQEDVENRRE